LVGFAHSGEGGGGGEREKGWGRGGGEQKSDRRGQTGGGWLCL